MQARCIVCRGAFNRQISEDKLRCPKCLEPEAEAPKWKQQLKKAKLKGKKNES
jgi:reverse gyrase